MVAFLKLDWESRALLGKFSVFPPSVLHLNLRRGFIQNGGKLKVQGLKMHTAFPDATSMLGES